MAIRQTYLLFIGYSTTLEISNTEKRTDRHYQNKEEKGMISVVFFLPGVYAIALGIQFLIGGSHICAYKRGLGRFNGKKGREKERK